MPANLGTTFFLLSIQIMITFILLIMALTCCFTKCKEWARKKVNGIFFNSLLAVIDAIFLLILMTAAINIQQVHQGNISIDSSFIVSIFALTVCFLELIFVASILQLYKVSLHEERRIERFGFIYEGLNYNLQGRKALIYPVIYQLRLVLLVYTILYLNDFMIIQVMLISYSTIYIMAILGTVHPLNELRQNYYEILSETVIVFTLDLMLFSSDPSIEPK